MLDILEIMERLPHRYPFLLVDRVIEINEEKTKIVAYKNVTINEQFFNGHFPGHPIMPGVLVIEGLAQALGVLVMGELKDAVPYYASIDNCKFKAPVRPGDKLVYEVEIVKIKGKMVKATGVDDVLLNDPHSEVTERVLKALGLCVDVKHQKECLLEVLYPNEYDRKSKTMADVKEEYLIFCPDAGAKKKLGDVTEY